METTFATNFVKDMFELEIANKFTVRKDTVTVTLGDGTKATITGKPVDKNFSPAQTYLKDINDIETYIYVMKHEFGYGQEPEVKELTKLELRNRQDLIVYLADACFTQLNATFDNFLLIFETGERFALIIN